MFLLSFLSVACVLSKPLGDSCHANNKNISVFQFDQFNGKVHPDLLPTQNNSWALIRCTNTKQNIFNPFKSKKGVKYYKYILAICDNGNFVSEHEHFFNLDKLKCVDKHEVTEFNYFDSRHECKVDNEEIFVGEKFGEVSYGVFEDGEKVTIGCLEKDLFPSINGVSASREAGISFTCKSGHLLDPEGKPVDINDINCTDQTGCTDEAIPGDLSINAPFTEHGETVHAVCSDKNIARELVCLNSKWFYNSIEVGEDVSKVLCLGDEYKDNNAEANGKRLIGCFYV